MKNTQKIWFSVFFFTLMTVGGAASYAASEQRVFLGSESLSDIGYASVLNGDELVDDVSPGKNTLPFPTERIKEVNEKRLEAIEEIRSDEKRSEEETAAAEPEMPQEAAEPEPGCSAKEIPVIRDGELIGCKGIARELDDETQSSKIKIIQ